jgi:maltose O-acetyltransferase
MSFLIDQVRKLKGTLEKKRIEWRFDKLKEMGMSIGKDVFMPLDIWVDVSHCFLISIGDRCRFGPNCAILAHDATMNEFLDAGRVGRVVINESCAFAFGTLIMPGVEIGPRVISAAFSVISTNIPPDSVVAGNPAKVIGRLHHFIGYHKMMMKKAPTFNYNEFGIDDLPDAHKSQMIHKLKNGDGYIVGGYSAMFGKSPYFSKTERNGVVKDKS